MYKISTDASVYSPNAATKIDEKTMLPASVKKRIVTQSEHPERYFKTSFCCEAKVK